MELDIRHRLTGIGGARISLSEQTGHSRTESTTRMTPDQTCLEFARIVKIGAPDDKLQIVKAPLGRDQARRCRRRLVLLSAFPQGRTIYRFVK